jgi:hypothetical protein
MPRLIDVALDSEGEISPGPNGDLSLVADEDCVLQEMRFRSQTVKGDYSLEPACGASLETLVGEAMDANTLARAEALLSEALLNDGFFAGYLEDIRAVPISKQQIALVVNLEGLNVSTTETVTVDLVEGELD